MDDKGESSFPASAISQTKHGGASNAKLCASSYSLPTSLVTCHIVEGTPTNVSVMLFSDKIFLSMSQLAGKIGTLLQVIVEDSVIDLSRTYNISTLLGRRDDCLLEVYARQIGERIASLGGKPGFASGGFGGTTGENEAACPPLLIGIALKRDASRSPEFFKRVVDIVVGAYMDAIKNSNPR